MKSFGFILIILWSVISAFAQNFTSQAEQKLDPFLVCLFLFVTTTLFFNIVNIFQLPRLMKKLVCFENLSDVIKLNLTTAGCWLLLLYPLKYIEPSIATAIIIGVGPFSTLYLGKFLYKKQNISKTDGVLTCCLLVVIFFLIVLTVNNKETMTHTNSSLVAILASIGCIFGGVILSVNALYTKRLSDKGFLPAEMLCIRFVFLILLSFVYVVGVKHTEIVAPITQYFSDLLIITFALIIIPQYLFQHALKCLEPISIAAVTPGMPVLIFFFAYSDNFMPPTPAVIVGVCLLLVITVVYSVKRYSVEKKVSLTADNQ